MSVGNLGLRLAQLRNGSRCGSGIARALTFLAADAPAGMNAPSAKRAPSRPHPRMPARAGLHARQGASSLSIEAQLQEIESYAAARSATILARFIEVESGRCPNRPELAKALHLAKVTGAVLVIAKLDRLSRNAAFLLTLKDSGVRFTAVDLPEAIDLTVGSWPSSRSRSDLQED